VLRGEAVGGPGGRNAGLLFPAEEQVRGCQLLQATCLTQFTASGCPSPRPLSYTWTFYLQIILQMVPGFSMTSPSKRDENECLNLEMEAEQLPENCVMWARVYEC
jgi:hypothetical protein